MVDNSPKLLTKPEVCSLVRLRPTQLMRRVRAGQFPQPFKMFDDESSSGRRNTIYFLEREVVEWIEQRTKEARVTYDAPKKPDAKPETEDTVTSE